MIIQRTRINAQQIYVYCMEENGIRLFTAYTILPRQNFADLKYQRRLLDFRLKFAYLFQFYGHHHPYNDAPGNKMYNLMHSDTIIVIISLILMILLGLVFR